MGAWSESQNAESILMLADGNAEFTHAIDLELDGHGFGLGTRSKRYAMVVEDGQVTALEIDANGIEKSAAEHILTRL